MGGSHRPSLCALSFFKDFLIILHLQPLSPTANVGVASCKTPGVQETDIFLSAWGVGTPRHLTRNNTTTALEVRKRRIFPDEDEQVTPSFDDSSVYTHLQL